MKFALTFILLLASLRPLPAAGRKVVMISIDGLKGTTLASIAKRNLRTPNLNEFVEKGAVSEGLEGVFPTVTYPSHTTLVTGRSPAAHGIIGNSYFDPEHKMNGAWYWYAEQIRVPALWDAAHDKGLKTAGVSWPVTVGAEIDFNLPEFRFPRTFEDKLLLRLASTKGLLEEFEKADGEVPITGQDDHLRARMAAFLLRTRKPDFLILHLMDMDHDEHGNGPDSPAALKTLETIDDCIGLVRKEVRNSGMEAQTVFLVVSDHGFRPV
ncbi:MAG: ectonucleotide pyrophosphatase/phosphodiesterase, partial [Bryobacteraceae bacterium]